MRRTLILLVGKLFPKHAGSVVSCAKKPNIETGYVFFEFSNLNPTNSAKYSTIYEPAGTEMVISKKVKPK